MDDWEMEMKRWTGEPHLSGVLYHHYGIRLQEVQPVGGLLCLNTEKGRYGLKRVRPGDTLRWQLIQELARHISEAGDHRIPIPVPTRRGQLTFAGMKNRYVLLPWMDGRIRDWNREKCWPGVARALARLHTASRGFSPSRVVAGAYTHTGKWEKIWKGLARQVRVLKVSADMSGEITPVDRYWLKHCSYTEGMLETAIRYLEKVGGDRSVQETRIGGEICHCNLHRRNVLWDGRGGIHFIDWNRAVLDVRSRDLARLILYAYGRTGSGEAVHSILHAYQEEVPLKEEDYGLIYAQLLFPQRLIRSLQRIYQERTIPADQALGHLVATVDLEEKKRGLLREFPGQIQREFQVKIPGVDWLQRDR
ncbi:phosphotransferase [Paludifilum halophilum]|nr:phosphotransferase [Paludifilum halophilum]